MAFSEGYVPSFWPAQQDAQRITMHLDFEVVDLPTAVPQTLDPSGHPFCLYPDASNGWRRDVICRWVTGIETK